MEDAQGTPAVEQQPEQAASNNVDEVSKKIDNLTAIVQNLQTKQDVLAQAAKQTKTVSMGAQAPVAEKTDLQYFEEYIGYCIDDSRFTAGRGDTELEFGHNMAMETLIRLNQGQTMEEIYNGIGDKEPLKNDKRWQNILKSLKNKVA